MAHFKVGDKVWFHAHFEGMKRDSIRQILDTTIEVHYVMEGDGLCYHENEVYATKRECRYESREVNSSEKNSAY